MAYIKIFPIKVTDKKALDYIMNPDKTEEKLLISSFACSPESADLEFAFTREEGKKNVMDKGNNLAFHLIQSFKPGEVDAETAHKLGKEFADEVLKGKYEYVSNKRSYHKICRISNRICQENGLVTSMPTGEKGKSYKENMEYHRGNSWKAKLKVAVDKAIWSSINYDEFLQKMKLAGYEIRQGKNLAFRAPEQKNFTNMKSLGSYYTEENVLLRLEKNRHKTKTPSNVSREVRLFINISSYVSTGNRAGFERWAQLNNLKEAARTFNYLSENNLLNYEDFRQHIADIDNSIIATEQRISELSSEISHQELIQKHCSSYRTCRKIVENAKTAPDAHKYKTIHQSEYQLHDTLKQKLQELGITKLPSPEKLQKKIDTLKKECSNVRKEKQDLENRKSTLNIISANINNLLFYDTHSRNSFAPLQTEHDL